MIDFSKPVQTRDGEPVQIISTSDGGHYPVSGYVGASRMYHQWMEDGRFLPFAGRNHRLDLIQVPTKADPQIDFTKPVQTRSGRLVRILSMEGPNFEYPVIGFITGETVTRSWSLKGRWCNVDTDLDIIQVPEPVKAPESSEVTFYANIYRSLNNGRHFGSLYDSRKDADREVAGGGRISCQKVTINVTPGQFEE